MEDFFKFFRILFVSVFAYLTLLKCSSDQQTRSPVQTQGSGNTVVVPVPVQQNQLPLVPLFQTRNYGGLNDPININPPNQGVVCTEQTQQFPPYNTTTTCVPR